MHSESVTALLYTVNCYSVSFPIPCGHKVPIEVCKRSVGQAENIIKQERDGKSAALRQHAQPKSMSRTLKMDTLGIEPRASRMLSGCDTTTPSALAVTQHTQDLQTKDAGNTEHLVCARQWAWRQIPGAAIMPTAARVDMEK